MTSAISVSDGSPKNARDATRSLAARTTVSTTPIAMLSQNTVLISAWVMCVF